MKKLVFILFLGTVLLSCKKVDPDADLAGINVTITGKLTKSCEDSTPVKYQVLRISDEVTQNFPVTTDSNGRFSFTAPATRTNYLMRANSKIILSGSFCFETKNIGTIFLNPCVKAIIHYDTLGHKKDYSKPFGIEFDYVLSKKNINQLIKPDTLLLRNRLNFYSSNLYCRFVFSHYANDAESKELLVPSYTYNHYTVKVP